MVSQRRHGLRRRLYQGRMRFYVVALVVAIILLVGEVIRPIERLGLKRVHVSSRPPLRGVEDTSFTASDGLTSSGDPSTKVKSNVSRREDDLSPKQLVIQVPTKMRSTPIPATIILPPSYEVDLEQKGRAQRESPRFSVVYLLHGATASHKAWMRIADVSALAERYGFVFVSPDGGSTSWWLDSPIDSQYQYETFVSEELVAYIDDNYRTIKDPTKRAVLGFSMGGHGAFYLAIRHPDVFGTAVALSGGVDIRPFPKQWEISKRLGPIQDFPDRWEEHSVTTQVSKHLTKATNLHLALDCGVGDFFLNVNRALHEKLLDMKIDHDYAERPGGHDAKYWEKAIAYQMVFVAEHIGSNHGKDYT